VEEKGALSCTQTLDIVRYILLIYRFITLLVLA